MSNSKNRAEMIANLRAMADLLEQHENLPVPYSVFLGVYPETMEAARTARKGIFGWRKEAAPSAAFTEYSLSLGGNEFGSVTYAMSVAKTDTCKRVQVGTKHVEAHDIPIYEWDCKPTEDDEETGL